MVKELKEKKVCGVGQSIDDYLDGTLCGATEELEDITIPGDAQYTVHVPEEPETDDLYRDFIK